MQKKIAIAFGNDITAEQVLESVDLEDVIPIYREIYSWLVAIATKKLNQIPNGATPEEE